MANAADDYAAIRRAMREHEEAEMANWLAMRISESLAPFVGQIVTTDTPEQMKAAISEGMDQDLYSFTDYVWPNPEPPPVSAPCSPRRSSFTEIIVGELWEG